MAATWPTFALILQDGYQESADYGVLRSDMDSGISKQRRRYSRPIVTRGLTFSMNGLDMKALFDKWVDQDLQGGVLWFDYLDPTTSIVKQGRMVGGKYQWDAPRGLEWTGSCQIETVG